MKEKASANESCSMEGRQVLKEMCRKCEVEIGRLIKEMDQLENRVYQKLAIYQESLIGFSQFRNRLML
jgi:hypothetical protein